MFNRKTHFTYDKERVRPVIHASICTGEQAAGFKDMETGKFEEIMLIRDQKDLSTFMKMYRLTEEDIKKEY